MRGHCHNTQSYKPPLKDARHMENWRELVIRGKRMEAYLH